MAMIRLLVSYRNFGVFRDIFSHLSENKINFYYNLFEVFPEWLNTQKEMDQVHFVFSSTQMRICSLSFNYFNGFPIISNVTEFFFSYKQY